MNDMRSTLERGVGGATPRPDGFERMLRRGDRKRRNQRISAGVVGIAVFVVTIWTVATGGPFDRSQTPGVSGSSVPFHPPGVAVTGLPPEGATPSLPKHGKLVLSLMFGHTGGDPGRFTLNLYEDGRMIWQRLGMGPDPSGSTGLTEQRLTPEGVELVRDEVISSGLFDRDLSLIGTYEYGLYFGQVTVRKGDRLVRVAWDVVGSTQGAETLVTPEQVQALKRLDVRLEDPGSWLPAGAWEDREIKPYVPSRYGVCYRGPQWMGRPTRILTLLPDAVADLLRTKDVRRVRFPSPYEPDVWCSDVTTDEARALVGALEDAGARGPSDLDHLEYQYRPGRSDAVKLELSPQWPDQV